MEVTRSPITVLVADDQALVREGVTAILSHGDEFQVVAQCADGAEAIRTARLLTPDVALLDIRMPRVDGLEATRQIVGSLTGTKVVIVTTFGDDEYLSAAIAHGASGFLLKGVGAEFLKEAIRAAVTGEAMVSPALTVRLFEQVRRRGRPRADPPGPPVDALTSREREITWHLAKGLSNAELMSTLHLSLGTVKSHLANIQSKLGVRNRVEIAAWAWSRGLMNQSAEG